MTGGHPRRAHRRAGPHRRAVPAHGGRRRPARAAPRLGLHRHDRGVRRHAGAVARPHRPGAGVRQHARFVRGRRHGNPSGPSDVPQTRAHRRCASEEGVRTASGSRAVAGAKARVARASRIWVEGIHDAELVEKVWGDDLRVEGIVVERLDGADHLADAVAAFGPAADARLGVLLDHLVPGQQGGPARRVGAPPARARDRHALRRRVAGRAPRRARDPRLAGDPEGSAVEGGGLRRARSGRSPRVLAPHPRRRAATGSSSSSRSWPRSSS